MQIITKLSIRKKEPAIRICRLYKVIAFFNHIFLYFSLFLFFSVKLKDKYYYHRQKENRKKKQLSYYVQTVRHLS